jgi:hypothetical protein
MLGRSGRLYPVAAAGVQLKRRSATARPMAAQSARTPTSVQTMPAPVAAGSAYLWYQAARTAGVRPSLKESSKLGIVLVPVTMGGALAALALVDPGVL